MMPDRKNVVRLINEIDRVLENAPLADAYNALVNQLGRAIAMSSDPQEQMVATIPSVAAAAGIKCETVIEDEDDGTSKVSTH